MVTSCSLTHSLTIDIELLRSAKLLLLHERKRSLPSISLAFNPPVSSSAMRIRKHFQVSSLAAGDSPVLPPRICRLNQSPWDVFDSPPSFPQVDGDHSFAEANGGISVNSFAATESVTNTKISDDGQDSYFDSEEEEEETIIMCAKSDGKRWRCKSEAARGNLLCEHHLEQLKNYQSLAQSSNKSSKKKNKEADVSAAPVSKTSRRVRARKTTMSTNPYEFYYYSGFGPSWGKKRGAKKKDELVVVAEEEEVFAEEDSHSSFSSSSEVHEIDRTDYVEEDEESGAAIRKRRGRKPIKARSLKSLM